MANHPPGSIHRIGQLLKIVKALPPKQLSKLKAGLDAHKKAEAKPKNLEALLRSGPAFTSKQMDKIAETRNAINKWRAK